jgi:hypothetical protein
MTLCDVMLAASERKAVVRTVLLVERWPRLERRRRLDAQIRRELLRGRPAAARAQGRDGAGRRGTAARGEGLGRGRAQGLQSGRAAGRRPRQGV